MREEGWRSIMKFPVAHILTIGSELLHGGRIDTNSVFLAEILGDVGVKVIQKIVVGDHPDGIRSALVQSARYADVIVTTGGLGSTLDDCTREAVAAAFGRKLVMRYKAKQQLQQWLRKRKRPMTPLLSRQAVLPSGTRLLENPVGTAPGFYLTTGGVRLLALPGVSGEALAMARQHFAPLLRGLTGRSGAVRWAHTFNTVGIPETEVQRLLMSVIAHYPLFEFSFLASPAGVQVTVSRWRGRPGRIASRMGLGAGQEENQVTRNVRSLLDAWLFSEGHEKMEDVVARLLATHALSLAVAESCTGGLVTHRLTEVPGSSAYLDRGVVTYRNEAKQQLLGVRPAVLRQFGAVSVEVAQAMACGVRARSQTDLGVGISGIAGPGGGSQRKPVGLVCIAVDGPYGQQARKCVFHGNRSEIKFRASQAALDDLRRYVLAGPQRRG